MHAPMCAEIPFCFNIISAEAVTKRVYVSRLNLFKSIIGILSALHNTYTLLSF